MVGQQSVEIGDTCGGDAQRLREIAFDLDQHRGIGILAQGREPCPTLARRDHNAVLAREAIGNINRRRCGSDRLGIGHGYSPLGGAGAFEIDGGTSVEITRPSGPRSSGRLTGPTVMSAAVASVGAGGTAPR